LLLGNISMYNILQNQHGFLRIASKTGSPAGHSTALYHFPD
jgi:hypothetical protein